MVCWGWVCEENSTPTSHTYRCDILPPEGGGGRGKDLGTHPHLFRLRRNILPPEGGGRSGKDFGHHPHRPSLCRGCLPPRGGGGEGAGSELLLQGKLALFLSPLRGKHFLFQVLILYFNSERELPLPFTLKGIFNFLPPLRRSLQYFPCSLRGSILLLSPLREKPTLTSFPLEGGR